MSKVNQLVKHFMSPLSDVSQEEFIKHVEAMIHREVEARAKETARAQGTNFVSGPTTVQ